MKLNTLPYGSHWVINSICKSFEKVGEGWGLSMLHFYNEIFCNSWIMRVPNISTSQKKHGADSEKAPSKERGGTFTGARRHLNRKKNDEKKQHFGSKNDVKSVKIAYSLPLLPP